MFKKLIYMSLTFLFALSCAEDKAITGDSGDIKDANGLLLGKFVKYIADTNGNKSAYIVGETQAMDNSGKQQKYYFILNNTVEDQKASWPSLNFAWISRANIMYPSMTPSNYILPYVIKGVPLVEPDALPNDDLHKWYLEFYSSNSKRQQLILPDLKLDSELTSQLKNPNVNYPYFLVVDLGGNVFKSSVSFIPDAYTVNIEGYTKDIHQEVNIKREYVGLPEDEWRKPYTVIP